MGKMDDTAVAWHCALLLACVIAMFGCLLAPRLYRRRLSNGVTAAWMLAAAGMAAVVLYLWNIGTSANGFLD